MFSKVLAAGLLSLGLGGAALAQTATTTTTVVDTFQVPAEWNENIANAMFSDITAGAARPADEITKNFKDLSPEEQVTVRKYCEQFNETGAGGRDAGTTDGTTHTAAREVCATAGKL